jgi:single-stranded DNA-binding protein
MNVVALVGRLSRPAEHRVLPSGDALVVYEVTVNGTPDGKRETVPVVWFGASGAAGTLDTDERVIVVGRVRRRFFRAAGRTGSRTEVVADLVVPTRQAKRAQAALDKARDKLLADVQP